MDILYRYKKTITYILVCIFIGIIIIINAIGAVPSFDGAMNVQVAENLMNNGMYSANYPLSSLFDVKIQTGITVNLPTAIILKVFGKNLGNAVLINSIYIVALFILVAWSFKVLKINAKWALFTIVAFICTPYFFRYGMGLYGEIPTLVWIILSIIFLEKNKENSDKYFFFSGICYGLAYLTKTVSLIGLPAILFVFTYRWLIKKDLNMGEIAIWGLGFISPIILFEIYKAIHLKGNYIAWWKEQYQHILAQTGVKGGQVDTNNKMLKMIKHIKIFASDFNINPYLFISLLITNFIVFCHRIYKEKNIKYLDILFLIGFSYFGWWLIITSDAKAWPRRIIIGALIMEIVTIYNALYIATYFKIESSIREKIFIMSAVAMALGLIVSNKDVFIRMNKRIVTKQSIIKMSDEIRKIGDDAKFVGFGWWQAPVLAFESGKVFYDYYEVRHMPFEQDTYLVVDRYAKLIANKELNKVLENIESELIYEDNMNYEYIYKINEFLPYQKFTEEDITKVTKDNYNLKDDYKYVRGIYNYESTSQIRWSMQDSCILLKKNFNTNNAKLKISYQISNYKKFIVKKPILKIFINNTEVYSKVITEDGIYNENIDIENILKINEVAQIRFQFNTKIDAKKDSRELSFILRDASLTK